MTIASGALSNNSSSNAVCTRNCSSARSLRRRWRNTNQTSAMTLRQSRVVRTVLCMTWTCQASSTAVFFTLTPTASGYPLTAWAA